MTASDLKNEPPPFQRLDQAAGYPYTTSEYLARTLWNLVQTLLIRPSPARCYAWRRFWLRRFGATIPDTSGTRPSTRVFHPWLLTLGQHTLLGDRVRVYNLGPITLGDHTVVSQDTHLCAGTHDHTQPNLPLLRPPITIGSGVWIAADAFIGPNVTIHNNAVIAARAVVTKDVPANTIAAGNPAQPIKTRPMNPTPEQIA
ncbi:putative colanic acid biosynthesis acetyltransferase [Mucisphaera sp.]|uniref:putative colanic acid biosynthesis acetyltransferase n=1 Tax=Mucisphaera sp. TaxID=2913024 RepID=UPI003D113049